MAEYKIKDIETLTGIKAHTIRIWEKRYGLVLPKRTDSHIRTYDDDELVLLLNIVLLNKNGIKISKIAELSNEEIIEKVWSIKGDTSIDDSTERLILALIELDELLFRTTIQNYIDKNGLEETFSKILVSFLDRIGIMWMIGTINPAQEHFISNLIRQKIIFEIEKLPVPDTSQTPIILFLPEHEWHEISLLLYHFVLRKNGAYTIYFGQSLPYDSLIESVEKLKPKALVSSWLTSVDEKFITNYFKNLASDTGGIPIYAGGYQIQTYSDCLKSILTEIKELSVLLQDLS